MHRSKFVINRRSSDKNRHETYEKHDNSTSLPIGTGPEKKPAFKNRYHPYQRNDKGDENQRQFQNSDQDNSQYFTFTRLKKLSTINSDNCIAELEGKKDQFDQLLNDVFRPDLLVLTIRVLNNICQANFTVIVTSILSHACSATFLKSLENYLTKLPFESDEDKSNNECYWEDKNGFWNNLMVLFKKITELLPSKARDELVTVLGKTKSIIATIETMQAYKINENVKDTILKLHNELSEEIIKFKVIKTVQETWDIVQKSEDPPEDFRTLSVIPTIQDLSDNNPFIRPCKLEGAYDSVEHYLDVQFRLLREDFIAPLRDGIQEYLYGAKKYRNTQLRIYKKVELMEPEEADNNVGVIASFGQLKHVDWIYSKRFLFGGLLCLSNDNFSSILFATVANRDEKLLQQGKVLIQPCEEDTVITEKFYHSNWVMLETIIYFEPYQVVLKAMRHMNDENFPMKKYLVDANTSISLPKYLKPDGVYQQADAVLTYKGFSLPIGENQAWPTPEKLKLDGTQYEAFKAALCEEFAVIQGPPGTGKTFIALEIIRTLLENKSFWRHDGPIVIVCLTNHALDQFLEGILKHTTSIVRVGSRSKSEALSRYTLAERRKNLPSARKYDRSFAVKIINRKKFIEQSILRSTQRTRLALKYLTTKDAVVPLSLLQEYCNDEKLHELYDYDELLQWLLADNNESMETELEPGEINSDISMDECYEEYNDVSTGSVSEPSRETNANQVEPLIFLLQSIDESIACVQETITRHLYSPRIRDSGQVAQLQSKMDALNLQRIDLERNLAQHPLLTSEQEIVTENTHWRYYWKWVENCHENAVRELKELEKDHRRAILELDEARQMIDLELLQKYDIVGFTTTSAARLHTSLRALRAPIVLVEEAAEILESHVVCSLTKSCQHVILIGDHKQLRPKAAVYNLGTKYNLNISLFERMVNIRGSCTQLAHQHRMRPEIAKLICPSIYETLHNHQSVLEYPPVMGLEKNVFFINHRNREMNHDNQESWTNPHEAKFLVAFARHLILQGYKSTEITILCTYTGQLFTLIKERNYYSILNEVRVTTIDNYQGEENKIILLSLVRNNEEGNIGFLKEENRVCVALSRAREGLYIMGNMDNLTTKNDIWPKIKNTLEECNAIGDSLELRCKFHPNKLISIKNVSDFEQCPEGGCLQKCNTDMPCGHMCTSTCHITNREHVNFLCKQNCVKTCQDDHPCPLLCYQGCSSCKVTVDRQLKCGHTVHILCARNPDTFKCPVKVDVILPGCNHVIQKACYMSLDKLPCTHPCKIRLPCGHSCELNCHTTKDPDHLQYVCRKPCPKSNSECMMDHPCKLQCHEKCIPCPAFVSKKRSCGHERMSKCSDDTEKAKCFKMMAYEKSCGHKLMVRCCRKDEKCEEEVMKTSTCGHKVLVKCYETPSSSQCRSKCKIKLKCGHPCTARCKDTCITRCNALIPQMKPGLCGHIISIPCRLKETADTDSPGILQYCKEPCRAELACGHICKGNCGSCKQGRIHMPCGEQCGNIFICGHRCEVPCRQECPPCEKPCQVKCRHSKCNKKCGELCTPCKEQCTARCRHDRCMKRCFELCARKPCEKPCFRVLKCGHKCIGFCGEPCPQLCRICDKEELMNEFFLGHEDEPNARFVLLEDCGHCIESKGLLTWVSKCNESIQVKTCPRCKTPISKCMRISNQIKKDLKDIQLVKQKIFGDQVKLQDQQLQLVEKIKDMKNNPVIHEFKGTKLLQNLHESMALVTKKQRRQIVHARAAEATQIVLDISQEICDKVEKIKNRTVRSYESVGSQVTMLFASLPSRGQISNQEIKDIERELQRLHYMIEVCIMESEADLDHSETPADQEPYDFIMKKLLNIYVGKFSEAIEKEIVNDLNELKTSHHVKVVLMNERKMIVKVMGYKQGHWYKCPNGHIYSIGECGGAMEQSKCHECGAAIGGHSHRLTSGNSVATEMDGATRPAWPGGN